MSDLTKLSTLEMKQGLLAGDFSAVELTSAHLDKIKQTNSLYNSFLLVTEEAALAQAKEAQHRIDTEKENAPLLTGIPIAVKDQFLIEGVESTAASKILKSFIPPLTCNVVQRLIDAGAVILGKTNQDEFAMGASGEHSAFGIVRNPINPDYVPGGSSSGSAVAVAAGQAPLALGTDTGGSMRIPASFTGIVGLKPTYGRVGRSGVIAFASSLDCVGVFGRDAKDVALALSVMAGKDRYDPTSFKYDPTSLDIRVPEYLKNIETAFTSIKSLKIGLPKEYFVDGIDSQVKQAVLDNVKRFEELGGKIIEISLPHTEFAGATYHVIANAEASSNLARYDGVRYGFRAEGVTNITELFEKTRGQGFGPEVKRRILFGTYVLSAGNYDTYFAKAQQVRTLIMKDFQNAFQDCDLIVTPTTPTTAFKIGENKKSPQQMSLDDLLTKPCSLAGLPGISIPIGNDSAGLPMGMQIIGKAFSELLLLSAAHYFMGGSK